MAYDGTENVGVAEHEIVDLVLHLHLHFVKLVDEKWFEDLFVKFVEVVGTSFLIFIFFISKLFKIRRVKSFTLFDSLLSSFLLRLLLLQKHLGLRVL